MTRRAPRTFCVNCGDPFRGEGELCGDCVPETRAATRPLPPNLHRCLRCGEPIALEWTYCRTCRGEAKGEGTRVSRMDQVESAGAVCPHCRKPLSWERTVGRMKRSLEDGTVEACYYCLGCRSTLEFATWVGDRT